MKRIRLFMLLVLLSFAAFTVETNVNDKVGELENINCLATQSSQDRHLENVSGDSSPQVPEATTIRAI